MLAGATSMAASAQQQTSPSPSLVFDGVTVVDVNQGKLVPDQRVVVAGTRVRAVGATTRVQLPRGARVVDARGKYLIPGLWDMHFHSYGHWPWRLYTHLIANGVTGIRDPGQYIPLDTLRRWRAEIAAGQRLGPRQIVTGTLLEGVDSTVPEGTTIVWWQDSLDRPATAQTGSPVFAGIQACTPAEARHVIDSLQRAGAEFIKLHHLAWSRETFLAAAVEARRVGTRLEGHLPLSMTVAEASDSGMRVIDHLIWLTGEIWGEPARRLKNICEGDSASVLRCAALARRLRHKGTWIQTGPMTPDGITNWNSPSCRMLGLMGRSGMPLLSGTDPKLGEGLRPNRSIHDELTTAVHCGLTPLQALQTVTLEPAAYLRGTDSLGTVARGKLADLVLLEANPLADITNTTKIGAVVANGRYFDRAALDTLLAGVARGAAEYERARAATVGEPVDCDPALCASGILVAAGYLAHQNVGTS